MGVNSKRSFTEPILIEIGGGETPHRASYVHLDIRPIGGVDIVSDAVHLPFVSAVADEIYAAHVIEHLSYSEGGQFLAEVARVLKVGGRLELSCPDLSVAVRIYGTVPDLGHAVGAIDHLRSVFYGAQTHKFDFHRSGYDFRLLSDELASAGFTRIARLAAGTEFHPTQTPEVRMLYELHIEALKRGPQEPAGSSICETPVHEFGGTEYLLAEVGLRNDQIAKLELELSEATSKIEGLKLELSEATSKIEGLKLELSEATSKIEGLKLERSRLVEQLNGAKTELRDIQSASSYKVVRFYASKVDRLCPDGTLRGELKGIVIRRLRILMGEGVLDASKKARRARQ